MSGAGLEAFLARIYVDQAAREQFLADPRGAATRAGLTAQQIEDLTNIDREGLDFFAHSLERKRAHKHGNQTNQHD